jgi:hypothetical protein
MAPRDGKQIKKQINPIPSIEILRCTKLACNAKEKNGKGKQLIKNVNHAIEVLNSSYAALQNLEECYASIGNLEIRRMSSLSTGGIFFFWHETKSST